jgi:hypothetical protein
MSSDDIKYPRTEDTSVPAGLMVEHTIPGAELATYYKVYTLNEDDALQRVRDTNSIADNETLKVVSKLNKHELTGNGMKPGDVKRWLPAGN